MIESRCYGVLDAPPSRGMTAVMGVHLASNLELIAHPAVIRAGKSSFTIRVDLLFTASHDDAFTSMRDRPVKTPVFA